MALKLSFILFVVLLILGSLFLLQGRTIFMHKELRQPLSKISINGVIVDVELARTQEEHTQGLSGRAALPENQGMLFVYDKPDLYSFWMKDMHFPIDIIWIGSDKKVVEVLKNVQPESFPEIFQTQKPAQYVLEANAGFAERYGVKVGTEVDLQGY